MCASAHARQVLRSLRAREGGRIVVKRLVLLTGILWAVFYVSQWLIRRLFDLLHSSIVESPWALILALAVPAAASAWIVGRDQGIERQRRAVVSLTAVLVAALMWTATGWILTYLPKPRLGQGADAALIAFLYLLYAIETALALPLVVRRPSDAAHAKQAH